MTETIEITKPGSSETGIRVEFDSYTFDIIEFQEDGKDLTRIILLPHEARELRKAIGKYLKGADQID